MIEKNVYKIVKIQTPDEILDREQLGSIGAAIVRNAKLYEFQLRGQYFIAFYTDRKTYNQIKNDKEVIIESEGYWNTLFDENVSLKRIGGIPIKILRTLT